MNKITKKLTSFGLAAMMMVSCVPFAHAAKVPDATIDMDRKCDLTLYKYDMTNAMKDGVWDYDSFISTGVRESYVEDTLGNAVRKGDANGQKDNALGNGSNSNGYAIAGVEFTTVKAADIALFTESANDGHAAYNKTMMLYGFDKVKDADLLKAIGCADGLNRYENADKSPKLDHSKWYYTSEDLNKAMAAALAANATDVKNGLEAYVASNPNSKQMPLTDEDGKTVLRNLPVGLYLTVETKVPEMVTSTTAPFFTSLPMTTVDGNEHSHSHNGGEAWNYSVTLYPKNETGVPTLEKTVREASKDTGKNNGSSVITDGFDHHATGSTGDVMEYQLISTLPTITSDATALTTYKFFDSLDAGLTYNKKAPVNVEIYTDKACTDKVASWNKASGMFTITYSSDDRTMTIEMTKAGLNAINGNSAANANGDLYRGYSNYTMRVTYSATVNPDDSFVFGDAGNHNEVVLTWKRTSSNFYDTLVDDCHVYSFGMDLTKLFSDKASADADAAKMFDKVSFVMQNATDGYYVTAKCDKATGIYYVNGHVKNEKDATVFTPVTVDGKPGRVLVKGLEDDKYIVTETTTANGYTLLKDSIYVTIEAMEDTNRVCDIYGKDILGVLQNDPRYNFDGGMDLHLANIPQKQLQHYMMTAAAKVDGNDVEMDKDHAIVALQVVNTPGFDIPATGDTGAWIAGTFGMIGLLSGAAIIVMLVAKKKDEKKTEC